VRDLWSAAAARFCPILDEQLFDGLPAQRNAELLNSMKSGDGVGGV
jgi:hypothetical protein